jgi:cobalt-zinc-cadmium efflux system outer membrane protein
LFYLGCAKTPPPSDLCIASSIYNRIDKATYWNQVYCNNELIDEALQFLLQQELTVDGAVQIALLNNPQIQALYADVGIAQADLIEAGLWSNPAFDIVFRYSNISGDKTNIEYSVTSSFIDLLLIPLRVKIAQAELEQTTLRVTNEILDSTWLLMSSKHFMSCRPLSTC